jgi:large subunit ribosomal protein L29
MALNPVDLRQMETQELRDKLAELRENKYKLRFAWHSGSLDNPNEMRQNRKDIARILTELRQREIAFAIAQQESQEKNADA